MKNDTKKVSENLCDRLLTELEDAFQTLKAEMDYWLKVMDNEKGEKDNE